ncbi:MAG: hypothetical protein AAF704_18285 [Cyanobacteria bacterium P01_D01_bin.123]
MRSPFYTFTLEVAIACQNLDLLLEHQESQGESLLDFKALEYLQASLQATLEFWQQLFL